MPQPAILITELEDQIWGGACNVSGCRDEGPVLEVNLGYLVFRLCHAHAHHLTRLFISREVKHQ